MFSGKLQGVDCSTPWVKGSDAKFYVPETLHDASPKKRMGLYLFCILYDSRMGMSVGFLTPEPHVQATVETQNRTSTSVVLHKVYQEKLRCEVNNSRQVMWKTLRVNCYSGRLCFVSEFRTQVDLPVTRPRLSQIQLTFIPELGEYKTINGETYLNPWINYTLAKPVLVGLPSCTSQWLQTILLKSALFRTVSD